MRLTVDPVEFRGFRYETGVSVTIYAPGRHEELGRGGRYICGDARAGDRPDACIPDAVLRAAPPRQARPRVYVPFGADQAEATQLRAAGLSPQSRRWRPVGDPLGGSAAPAAARHILRDGSAVR